MKPNALGEIVNKSALLNRNDSKQNNVTNSVVFSPSTWQNQVDQGPIKSSAPTYLSEIEAIDVTLKVVNLLELLHSKSLVHTNLCP